MTNPGRSSLMPALIMLGIGLSGFFDGILLHQVLQWHHLLSLVSGTDLRAQLLADGLFHVLMYIIVAIGLVMLWQRRHLLAEAGSARRVAGGTLLGFGLWNVIDVALFHWILGIHRIRVDVPSPMAYDLGWLAAFAALPLAAAWILLRAPGHSDGRGAGVALTLILLVAAPVAALPPPVGNTSLVVFAPGVSTSGAVTATLAQGRIIWTEPDARLMAVALERPDATAQLYRAGALLVTRSPSLAGCIAAAVS